VDSNSKLTLCDRANAKDGLMHLGNAQDNHRTHITAHVQHQHHLHYNAYVPESTRAGQQGAAQRVRAGRADLGPHQPQRCRSRLSAGPGRIGSWGEVGATTAAARPPVRRQHARLLKNKAQKGDAGPAAQICLSINKTAGRVHVNPARAGTAAVEHYRLRAGRVWGWAGAHLEAASAHADRTSDSKS